MEGSRSRSGRAEANLESGSLVIPISLQNYKHTLLKCLLRNLMKFKVENNLFQKVFTRTILLSGLAGMSNELYQCPAGAQRCSMDGGVVFTFF